MKLSRLWAVKNYIVLLFFLNYSQDLSAQYPPKPEYTEKYYQISGNTEIESKKRTGTLKQDEKILSVGPGKTFALPSVAAKFASDGDIIEIHADGDYLGDEATWKQNNITIKGVGGKPHIRGRNFIGNKKAIWVIKGNNVKIDNIELSNAKVRHKNGAAIRAEGKRLEITNSYFHHNENGILTSSKDDSVLIIKNSEFSYNGYGRGKTHNIYVGKITEFTLIGSYIHHANVGHNVKTRAKKNIIMYNKIADEKSGNSSYAIDVSNGGETYIIGNIIQQGEKTENSTLVSFATEKRAIRNKKLYMINNTLINDRHYCIFLKSKSKLKAGLLNNIFVGKGKIVKGEVENRSFLHLKNKSYFIDPDNYDYRIKKAFPGIDKGEIPNILSEVDLKPSYQYVHPLKYEIRKIINKIDIGAYEFQ